MNDHPDHAGGAYREGLSALLSEHKTRRLRVVERAQVLDAAARAELPAAQLRDLEIAEAHLARTPTTKEELEAAEKLLDEYERLVDVVLSLVAGLHEQRAQGTDGRARRRRAAVVAAACLIVIAGGLVASGRHADQQVLARRREAFWAGCRANRECGWYGLCGRPPPSMRDDSLRCFATSDADCAASYNCAEKGLCHARDGVCQVLTDADCARSRGCLEEGECRADRGACRALVDADCTQQGRCVHGVFCTARDGKCVPTDESCSTSSRCTADGRCGAFGEHCEPRSVEDCKQSRACRSEGECGLLVRDHRFCVVSDEGCRGSELCENSGRCNPGRFPCQATDPKLCVGDEKKRPDTCLATSADDCARSAECATRGLCALGAGEHRGSCVASDAGCRATVECRRSGFCTARGPVCRAGTLEDCRRSERCKGPGTCTLGEGGICFLLRPWEKE